jgi:anti-sigma factor ChrR (cupin superfamily)
MRLHADFTQRVVLRPGDAPWQPSPSPGVTRCLLDRVGEEDARATSLVRYAPGSVFPTHAHPDGEEILVLDGTFSDDTTARAPTCATPTAACTRRAATPAAPCS